MPSDRTVAALVLVGLVLVPAPAYSFALGSATDQRHRVPNAYGAAVVDPTTANGRELLVERYGDEVGFYVDALTAEYNRDDFAAPNDTATVLRSAVKNGNATTSDRSVRSDLEALASDHEFLVVAHHDAGESPEFTERFYRFTVVTSGGSATVETTPVNRSEVATVVLDTYAVEYESLPADERRTVAKIIDNSDPEDPESYAGYRPYGDEPMPERPLVVEKDGRYYDVRTVMHVDDFSFPPGFLPSLLASGLGLVILLGATAGYVVRRVRGD